MLGGDGEEGRDVSVAQFKNKLNAIRKAYKAKRTRMLATGNQVAGASSADEDGEEDTAGGRKYPELPSNVLLNEADSVDDSGHKQLTCDPRCVRPVYRRELGNELAALWPLLCDVFTGEAIIESGLNASDVDSDENTDDLSSNSGSRSDDECSDSPSDARENPKAAAKLKKQKQLQQQQQQVQSEAKRPVELLNDTLRDGFSTFGRIFERRQPSQPDANMSLLVEKLTSSIDASNAKQQEATQAICQSIASLQETTAGLFREMMKQFQGQNPE